MSKSFEAQIADWVRETEGAVEAVFKQSAQEVLRVAQTPAVGTTSGYGLRKRKRKDVPVRRIASTGRMPIYTGFLRGSLTVGINSEPADITEIRDGENYALDIVPARLGDTLLARWTADYAKYVEYGTGRIAAAGFARHAVDQWPSIVAKVVADLAGRLGR